MLALLLHLLLAVSVAALWAGGVRVASLAVAGGLERALAAVALAGSAAVSESLALGLVGLGTNPAALTGAAVATWLGARLWLPAPERPVLEELRASWRGLPGWGRAAGGAIAGIAAAWAVWTLGASAMRIDAVAYHVPELMSWVHNGQPGSIVLLTYEFPVGNYPVTHEVLAAWVAGISRGTSAVLLLGPASVLLLGAAAWLGLRRLGAAPLAAGLAAATLCTLPILPEEVIGPNTDLPAFAWLATAAALAGAAARPGGPAGLLPLSVLAAALAVGTKTTTLPMAAAAVGIALLVRRRALGRLWVALGAAAAGALVVGGIWYLRNLVDHGSPFWPFVATSWGDPVPELFTLLDASFLDRPGATLEGRVGSYLDVTAGGLVLVAGGLLAPLFAPGRATALAALATALGALIWATAPLTGIADHPALEHFSLTTVRYLLPTMAAGALALALAARGPGRGARAATVVLGVGLAWNLLRLSEPDFTAKPSGAAVILGALAGAGAVVFLSALVAETTIGPRARAAVRALATPAALVASAVALTLWSADFTRRYVDAGAMFHPVVGWFESQPAFRDGEQPISFAPQLIGPLAGDRLQHRLELIPARESCREVADRARDGWVVIREIAFPGLTQPFTADDCLAGERPTYQDGEFRIYAR